MVDHHLDYDANLFVDCSMVQLILMDQEVEGASDVEADFADVEYALGQEGVDEDASLRISSR